MKRMIVTIPDEDKSWLESYSHTHHQSVSETIRRAIRSFRETRTKAGRRAFLAESAGLWKARAVDGLDYVRKARNEWGRLVKSRYLVDTDVLIDHLNGVEQATAWLQGLLEGEAVISVITRAEVLSGAAEEEMATILLLLDSYECLEIGRRAADKAAELRRQKKWKLPDAVQAALCAIGGLKLVTRNTGDFDPDRHDFVLVPYAP